MIGGKKVLAVIPARGGSKRLPRKNILDIAGKPLIAWSIEAARKCSYIDQTIVSTEDMEISVISRDYGVEIPFMRPEYLATDKATTIDVVLDVITTFASNNDYFDFVVVLQPTSPLRNSHHLDKAFELLYEKNARAIISVCQAEHHPHWCNTLPDDLSMDAFIREDIKNLRSQDLPTYYRLNGAIYICDVKLLKQRQTLLPSEDSYAYLMTQRESVDIDTLEDFEIAEAIMRHKQR